MMSIETFQFEIMRLLGPDDRLDLTCHPDGSIEATVHLSRFEEKPGGITRAGKITSSIRLDSMDWTKSLAAIQWWIANDVVA